MINIPYMFPKPLGLIFTALVCLCAAPSAVQAELYAYDDFGTEVGLLTGWNGGSGWAANWEAQNNAPGWKRDNIAPLTYGNLLSSSGYAIGGDNYTASGRVLNSANFGAARLSSGAAIGEPGSELWMSVLARRDSTENWRLSANMGGGAAWTSENPRFTISVASNSWVLIPRDQDAAAVSTGVPATIGEAYLLVLHVAFGDPDVISLFVNPDSLGGEAPTEPDASLSMNSADISFTRLLWYPGSQVNRGSIDEIRFGSTYADVTPLDPNPNTLPEVTIINPVEGATIVQGQIITFTATADDAEDGDVSASLEWSSNLDGVLGTGGSLQVAIAELTLGEHIITATASDSGGRTSRARIEVTVEQNTELRILTNALPDAVVGTPYTTTLEAFGGVPPYTWGIASGSMPSGFTLDANNGRIAGQSQALVNQNINFRVTDAVGAQGTRSLTLRAVAPASTGPVLYTSLLPPVTLGVPYDFTLSADETAVKFVVRSGSLPAGLTLDENTGRLHGTVPLGTTRLITDFEIWVGNSQFNPSLPVGDSLNNTYRTARLFGMRMSHPNDAPRFVRVFIASGQSNMGGSGADAAAIGTQYQAPLSDVWYAPSHPTEGPNLHVNDWIPMGKNPLTPGVGCELSFARRMADAFPYDRIAIIKASVGGSGIHYWLPGNKGFETLREAIDLAQQRLDTQVASGEISGYEFSGLIWMQGENEADTAPEFGANYYDTSLSTLVSSLESAIGSSPLNTVIGRLDIKLDNGPDQPGVNAQSLAIVRTKQREWAEARSWADWIDTDDLAHVDYFHFNGPAFITMGERFASAMTGLLGGPQTEMSFSVWQGLQQWNGAASGATDDPDADSRPNLLEYFSGTNPLLMNPGTPYNFIVESGESPQVTISVPRAQNRVGVVLQLETSQTLMNDSWAPLEGASFTTETDSETDALSEVIEFPFSDNSVFFRLRLSEVSE